MGNKKISVEGLDQEKENLEKLNEEARISAIESKYSISREEHPSILSFLDEYNGFSLEIRTYPTKNITKYLGDANSVIKELLSDTSLNSPLLFLEIMKTCLSIYRNSDLDHAAIMIAPNLRGSRTKLNSFLDDTFSSKNKLFENYQNLCLQYVERGLAQKYPNQLVKLFHEMVEPRPDNTNIEDIRRHHNPVITLDDLGPEGKLFFETNGFNIPLNEKLFSKLHYLRNDAKIVLDELKENFENDDLKGLSRDEIIKCSMKYAPDPKKSIDALIGFLKTYPTSLNGIKNTIGFACSGLSSEDIDSIPEMLSKLIEVTYGPEISDPLIKIESSNQKLARYYYQLATIREDESKRPSWERQHANPKRDTWTTLATLSK